MLSKQLGKKLVYLFQFMGQIEKQVEVLREVLCGQSIFEPYILFRQLDKNHKGYISSKDLQNFIQSNDKDYALEDLDILIKQLSQRSDNQWRYTDFMHIVLTTENVKLRSLVTQRPTYDMKALPLPYDVTFGFLRIIEKEMEQIVKLNTLKYELQKTKNFDIKKIFDSIDTFGTGSFLHNQLGVFLLNNQIGSITENSLVNYIFRRLDVNRDNQVDIEDLKISLEVNGELIVIPKEHPTILMDKTNQSNNTRLYDKTSKNQSYIQSENVLKCNQKLEYPNRRSMVSVTKHVVKMRNANLNRSPGNIKNSQQNQNSINDELIYLVECLRIFTKLELECEKFRELLSQQEDFNVLDVFEAFNIDQTAKLCPSDIGSALEQFGMYPNQTQLFLWVKRYDKDHDGKLNVREFVQSLLPSNEILKKKISQRPQRILNASFQQRIINNDNLYQQQQVSYRRTYTPQYLKNFLCADTVQLVCQCIKVQIENEVAIEAVRQRVCKRPNFDLKKLFKILDSNGDGLICTDDFRRILEDHGTVFQEQELKLLKNRFDKNDDSMISYGEFIGEIYPKTKHKL